MQRRTRFGSQPTSAGLAPGSYNSATTAPVTARSNWTRQSLPWVDGSTIRRVAFPDAQGLYDQFRENFKTHVMYWYDDGGPTLLGARS